MQRAVVFGNCQALALELMLNTNEHFSERFELVSFPPVHEIPAAMVPELHAAVAGAAVLVAQRVDDGYRDNLGVGTETLASIARQAIVVRWPSVFWAGYAPDLFYLRAADGQPVVDGPFDYHDRSILRAYADGLDVAGACRLLEDPERPSDARAWAQNATAELDVRGQGCDVQVAEYISSRFQEELLFFTMNHPANRLLGCIAQQVTELIGIRGRVDPERTPGELLGSTFYPLHANHVRALELEPQLAARFAAGATPFKIRGETYEPAQAVQAFFDYYAAHPQLVELNLT
ncbi:MAG TPA: WcbI family polysaccharide biosynthesis putative acetyltransferase [Solirubrobacteraceae bacterium]|nr:WcbI family polysaccharide biosynthesis putative acetyltransferase [Solirubrobacteraceae bacterium]